MKMIESQIEDVLALVKRAHTKDGLGSSYVEGKVRRLLTDALHNPKTLVLVNKQVSAILAWMLVPSSFSYKNVIHEIVFYSETAGSGFRLLKESEEWLDSWGDSIEGVSLNTTSRNEKIDDMIERFGYEKVGSQFIKRGR